MHSFIILPRLESKVNLNHADIVMTRGKLFHATKSFIQYRLSPCYSGYSTGKLLFAQGQVYSDCLKSGSDLETIIETAEQLKDQ